MSEEKTMPKGWNQLYKSLTKKLRDLIDQGDFVEAFSHPEHYEDLKTITKLFLMKHHMEKWDKMAKNEWFVKSYVSNCCEDYEYYTETSNYFKFFRENKRNFTFEDCGYVQWVDRFIELHNGEVPTSINFFSRLNDIYNELSPEEQETPPLEVLDYINK